MAYSTDPSNPGAAAFASARITPEEAERLAATFRPSWELDEAPAAGRAAAPVDLDARGSKGITGTPADVRGAVHALNGTHAPAPAAVLHEPSVIIEPTLDGPELRAPASPFLAVPVPAPPPMRSPVLSLDLSEIARRPRTGLWIGLGAAGLVIIGIALWLTSGSTDKPSAAIPAEKPQVAATSRIPPPPPPVETATATRPAAVPSPLAPASPTSTVVSAAPPPAPAPPPPPVAAAPPPPRLVVPPAPRPPTWTPPAAAPARPAARAKGNATPTIVRDVPF